MSDTLCTKRTKKERFFQAVLRHRKGVIILYVVLALVSLLASQAVGVNYDILDFLPENTPSSIAVDVMEEEFDGDTPNARVMLEDVTVAEALDYKARIDAVPGVIDVTWFDDVGSISIPLDLQDASSYYRDGAALFSVSIADSMRSEAVGDIREIIGDKGSMTGSAVSTAVSIESTVFEVGIVTAVAILFILIILILTTRSWIEPILVLAGLGVAVAINNGTHLIFGEVSFVTNAAGSILQVAIALDFSVFLLHRYREVRGSTPTREGDMVQALCYSSNPVTSSACTDMIGFLALATMQFLIGPDLGLALAKGILISLITVFTLTPCLFIAFDKLYERTEHRPFVPSMKGFARVVGKVCVPIACVFVLLPVPAYLASTSEDVTHYYGASFIYGPGTELGDDTAHIEEVFGKSDTYVLMVPVGNTVAESALSRALHEIPEVNSIISYVDMASSAIPLSMIEESTLAQLQSDKYSRMVLNVSAHIEGDETVALVEEIRATAEEFYPGTWLLAGDGVGTADLRYTIVEDKRMVDLIAVVAMLLVLLIATRSLTLPVILVFCIETAIWCNFAWPYFSGAGEFYLSYLIVSAIQLGVTVDYAILLSDRYLEMRRTLLKKDALRATLEAVTIPIITSATVLVVVGLVMSNVSSNGILAQLGHFLGVGVVLSLLAVLFALPGLLYLLDGVIERTTLKARFARVNDVAAHAAHVELPEYAEVHEEACDEVVVVPPVEALAEDPAVVEYFEEPAVLDVVEEPMAIEDFEEPVLPEPDEELVPEEAPKPRSISSAGNAAALYGTNRSTPRHGRQ